MNKRLYYLDALRGFAILMMLQGHFVSSMLDVQLVDTEHFLYRIWLYCRGFTAPLFFTISGWIIAFLLLKNPLQGLQNLRIKKGIKRFVQLIFWGYLIRLNLPMLFSGKINSSFLKVDVLQIIGCGLLFIILIYVCFYYLKRKIGWLFLILGVVIFIYEPVYSGLKFDNLPVIFASYLTKANGGVFYLLPWLGYVSIGAFFGCFITQNMVLKDVVAALLIVLGLLLIYKSSSLFIQIDTWVNYKTIFYKVAYNNYLFIRLGDVLLFTGLFMFLDKLLRSRWWKFVGTKTLDLYIVHYFILFGSLTGIGLQKLYPKSLNALEAVFGALAFISLCILVVYLIDRLKLNRVRRLFTVISTNISDRNSRCY